MRLRSGLSTSVAAALALGAGWATAAAADFGPSAFTQLSGTRGCLMQIGYDIDHGCARVGGLDQAQSVTTSPDDRFVYVGSGGSLTLGSNGVVVLRRDTGTGELAAAGCVTATSGDGRIGTEGACARGDALLGVSDVAISPDGRNGYVTSAVSNGIAWLDRDPAGGGLTPAGCLKDAPRGDRCGALPQLAGAAAVALSADGADAYVVAHDSAALHVLRREPATGALAPVQCLSETGSDGRCEPAAALQGAADVAVAADGRAVYVAGDSGALAIFGRDPATGRLTETGCLLTAAPPIGPCSDADGIAGAAGVAVSPDGRDVYVAATEDDAVASFRVGADGKLTETGCVRRTREESDDGTRRVMARCAGGTAIWSPREVVVSADGRTVFAGGLDTITSFRRDGATGALTQSGCAEEEKSSSSCLEIRATLGVNGLAATADGRNVYVTASEENAVTVLGAAVTIASSALRAGAAGRVRVPLACPATRSRACAGRVRLGGGAARPYRIRAGRRALVRVRLAGHARRALARRGRLGITAWASDGLRSQRATHRHVTLLRHPRAVHDVRAR